MRKASIWRRFQFLAAIVIMATAASAGAAHAQEPASPWEGWYAGGIAGYAWTDVDITMSATASSRQYNGIAGGALAGYNFSITDMIIGGFETDITFADLAGDMSLARHKASFLGRLGVLVTPSTLVFAVGGLAGGQYEAEVTATGTTMTLSFDDEVQQVITTTVTAGRKLDKRLWGYTLGGGFETQVTAFAMPALFGVEYRYTNFEQWNFSVIGQGFSIDPEVQEVRVRFSVPIN